MHKYFVSFFRKCKNACLAEFVETIFPATKSNIFYIVERRSRLFFLSTAAKPLGLFLKQLLLEVTEMPTLDFYYVINEILYMSNLLNYFIAIYYGKMEYIMPDCMSFNVLAVYDVFAVAIKEREAFLQPQKCGVTKTHKGRKPDCVFV